MSPSRTRCRCTAIVSVPPRGIASRALIARLRIAVSSSPGSTKTSGRPAGASTATLTISPSDREQLARQLGAARDGAHRAGQDLEVVRPLGKLGLEQLQVAGDDGQQVV